MNNPLQRCCLLSSAIVCFFRTHISAAIENAENIFSRPFLSNAPGTSGKREAIITIAIKQVVTCIKKTNLKIHSLFHSAKLMGNSVFCKCIMNVTRRKKVLHAITIPDANKTISQFYNIVEL